MIYASPFPTLIDWPLVLWLTEVVVWMVQKTYVVWPILFPIALYTCCFWLDRSKVK